jgi:hypothetical protein
MARRAVRRAWAWVSARQCLEGETRCASGVALGERPGGSPARRAVHRAWAWVSTRQWLDGETRWASGVALGERPGGSKARRAARLAWAWVSVRRWLDGETRCALGVALGERPQRLAGVTRWGRLGRGRRRGSRGRGRAWCLRGRVRVLRAVVAACARGDGGIEGGVRRAPGGRGPEPRSTRLSRRSVPPFGSPVTSVRTSAGAPGLAPRSPPYATPAQRGARRQPSRRRPAPRRALRRTVPLPRSSVRLRRQGGAREDVVLVAVVLGVEGRSNAGSRSRPSPRASAGCVSEARSAVAPAWRRGGWRRGPGSSTSPPRSRVTSRRRGSSSSCLEPPHLPSAPASQRDLPRRASGTRPSPPCSAASQASVATERATCSSCAASSCAGVSFAV